MPPLMNNKLSPEKFRMLRDLIYDRSGIYFTDGKLYLLESRLGRRLSEIGMESFDEYTRYLKNPANQKEEFIKIFNLITINETFFFRYPKQLEVFAQVLFPQLLKRRQLEGKRRIKIWSAASSSGEELYTLGMLLKEKHNGALNQLNLDLVGTDISHKILSKAKEGKYTNNSFRQSMDPFYKSKYFTEDDNKIKIKEVIKKMARFGYMNLNDLNAIRMHNGTDFIFCRNVLIYFDQEVKKRVVRAFYDVLNHGGYLFLGEAESLHGISSAYKVEHFPGTFVYKKE